MKDQTKPQTVTQAPEPRDWFDEYMKKCKEVELLTAQLNGLLNMISERYK